MDYKSELEDIDKQIEALKKRQKYLLLVKYYHFFHEILQYNSWSKMDLVHRDNKIYTKQDEKQTGIFSHQEIIHKTRIRGSKLEKIFNDINTVSKLANNLTSFETETTMDEFFSKTSYLEYHRHCVLQETLPQKKNIHKVKI